MNQFYQFLSTDLDQMCVCFRVLQLNCFYPSWSQQEREERGRREGERQNYSVCVCVVTDRDSSAVLQSRYCWHFRGILTWKQVCLPGVVGERKEKLTHIAFSSLETHLIIKIMMEIVP